MLGFNCDVMLQSEENKFSDNVHYPCYLDVNVLRTCTTAMLSMWKSMRLFDNHVCHNRSETYTGNSSKNVM